MAAVAHRVAVGVEILALFGGAGFAVVVELEQEVAFVVGDKGLEFGPALAVALT